MLGGGALLALILSSAAATHGQTQNPASTIKLGGAVAAQLASPPPVTATETVAGGGESREAATDSDYGPAALVAPPTSGVMLEGDMGGGMMGGSGVGMAGGYGGAMMMSGGGPWPGRRSSSVPEPSTELAREILRKLDANFESVAAVQLGMDELDSWFVSELQIPLLLDRASLELAEVGESVKVDLDVSAMPLRSALRKAFQPLGLKAVVEDEGIVVVADHTELARRGIQTDRWLDVTPEVQARFEEVMSQKVSYHFPQIPLEDVARQLSEDASFPIKLDRVAMEELGLTADVPVTGAFQDISLRSALKQLLRELDFTYSLQNEALLITSVDAAQERLRPRIYWLEATGLPRGDFDDIIQCIESNIYPEIWHSLGGNANMFPLQTGEGNRPSLLVSAPDEAHERIESLFDALRQSHTGPDPVSHTPKSK